MTASKPPLSVSFHNFWGGFDPATWFLTRALSDSFDVRIVAEGCDLQISSVFGAEILPEPRSGRRALRVWYTGEARDPQHQLFDLYFGFRQAGSLLGKRWHRLPLWSAYLDWWDQASPFHVSKLFDRKAATGRSRFCNFIFSAPASLRAEFMLRLDEARSVDSIGKILNNRDGKRPAGRAGKVDALSQSTFTIAFENQIGPGYITEKIVEPLLAGSIPIYWGTPDVRSDFNPDAFVFADDFAGFDDLVAHVVRLADSREAVAAMTAAPAFPGNRIAEEYRPEFFSGRIREALSGGADTLLPGRLLRHPLDPASERSLKTRLRRLRSKLARRRLPPS